MGNPRKLRATYESPVHPWQKERLETEKSLVQEYGLVNKKEIYKASSRLKRFKTIAKGLASKTSAYADKEKEELFSRLSRLNILHDPSLDVVLGLPVESVLDRRLQSVVFKKGLARTVKQARQMIVHRHIAINNKVITSPGHLVTGDEENNITFYPGSGFSDENHPERVVEKASSEEESSAESGDEKSETKKDSKDSSKAQSKDESSKKESAKASASKTKEESKGSKEESKK